ncbi:hypothetical protein ACJD0Z_17635 [Flavobacteriaceae bacterium M23B6Z8]
MNWCIIIPLLVGLISAILGYLLGRLSSKSDNSEVEAWERKYKSLEADLADCKSKLAAKPKPAKPASPKTEAVKKSPAKGTGASAIAASAPALVPFNADLAKSVFGKRIKQDDLKVVEGIGPKIEGLFNEAGIKTWKALSECSVEKCQEVLNSGGDRYRIHNPGTWPKQAKMAYENKWEELKKWQDSLKGGK